jgi:hypothetical protein
MKISAQDRSDETLHWRFPLGYGKQLWIEAQAAAGNLNTTCPGVLCVFRDIGGKLQFIVEGWDDDPREMYEISEVRRYFGALTQGGPAWSFVTDLQEPQYLKMKAACSVAQIEIARKKSWDFGEVAVLESVIREFAVDACARDASDMACRQPSDSIMQIADAVDALLQQIDTDSQ